MLMVVALLCVTTAVMAQNITAPAEFQVESSAPMIRAGHIPMPMRQGDVNVDGKVGMDDLSEIINLLLSNGTSPNGDVNIDGVFGMDDLSTLINMLLTGTGSCTASSSLSALNDIYYSMHVAGWSTTGNTHQCFGISAYNLMAEVMGDDMIMGASGSGWYWYDANYGEKYYYKSSSWRSYDLWNAYYTWIADANYILAMAADMTGTADEKNYVLGQAYAIRAYSYFMLAQSFARTYKGHESEPCVPLFEGTWFGGSTGNPRSTVQQVYAQIDADIIQAMQLLEGLPQQRPIHISHAVVKGLRARVCLVKEEWASAYIAARDAINEVTGNGGGILDVPAFKGVNNASVANVMWGADIPEDEYGMYASFWAHMCTSKHYGQSAPKQITHWLYDKMSDTDSRRAWWNPESQYSNGGYAQTKFDVLEGTEWGGDYIWMRVEEMYLTAAEAGLRAGLTAKAKEFLTELMSHRDPGYSCTKTGTELGALTTEETGSLLEEILIQRRLELWGEDGRIYTIRRLRQGFERSTDDGWPYELAQGHALYDPENYSWILSIPQSEFDGNPNLDPVTDQNPLNDYPAAGNHISFADQSMTVNTPLVVKTIQVPLTRANSKGYYRVVVNKTSGDANITVGSNPVFYDGESSTTLVIYASDLVLGQDYVCDLELSDIDKSSYNPEMGVQHTRLHLVVHCANPDGTGQNISFTSSTEEVSTGEERYAVSIPLMRAITSVEYRAAVMLEDNDGHASLDNSVVTFREGVEYSFATVTFSGMEKGKTYTCTLRLSPADAATVDPAAGGQITSIQVRVTRLDVEQAGTAYLVDYTFSNGDYSATVPVYHIVGGNTYYLSQPFRAIYSYNSTTEPPVDWYFTLNADSSITPVEGVWEAMVSGYNFYYDSTNYPNYCYVSQNGNEYMVNSLVVRDSQYYAGGAFSMLWNR